MGLERMLPSEVQIVENYDEFGFFRPNYIQVKNNQKKDFAYADVIHIKKSTHRSNAWGLACLPIAINIEILGEIKTFDYNKFKNGLMIDYFVIVEGGTLTYYFLFFKRLLPLHHLNKPIVMQGWFPRESLIPPRNHMGFTRGPYGFS